MSPRHVHFSLYEEDGDALLGATPTWLTFYAWSVEAAGWVVATPPAVGELGAGEYYFTVPSEMEEGGVVYLLDAGEGSTPRYVAGGTLPAVGMLVTVQGLLWPGAAPYFVRYHELPDGVLEAPPLVMLGVAGGLAAFNTLAGGDEGTGISWAVDCPATAEPRRYEGVIDPAGAAPAPLNTPPLVTVVGPPAGSPITADTVLRVRVTDTEGLRTVRVFVVSDAAEEVAFNGATFTPPFSTSERTPIAGGWEFALRRRFGWPRGGFTLKVLPLDTAGEEG